jgi:hypothetical protein
MFVGLGRLGWDWDWEAGKLGWESRTGPLEAGCKYGIIPICIYGISRHYTGYAKSVRIVPKPNSYHFRI